MVEAVAGLPEYFFENRFGIKQLDAVIPIVARCLGETVAYIDGIVALNILELEIVRDIERCVVVLAVADVSVGAESDIPAFCIKLAVALKVETAVQIVSVAVGTANVAVREY